MNPCANCGATPRPTDRFCNTCGTPVVAAEAPAAPQYVGSAAWGAPAPAARCQLGHEVAPGQNYCREGHPIALEEVHFAPAAPTAPQYAPTQGAPYGGPSQGSGAKYAQAGQPQVAPAAPYGGSGNAYPSPQYPQQPPAYPPPAAAAYVPPAPPPPPPPPPPVAPGYAPSAAAPAGGSPAPAANAKPAVPVPASALTGFLIAFETNPSGDFWPLTGGRHTLGRANSGDTVNIPLADATISSRHAVIDVDAIGGKIQIEDTGSTNGTFVNDDHVGFSGKRELKDGDRLRLGGFTTLVKVIARG